MKINLPPTKKARIEMLPLMDIVFLLLVVFIYSMISMSVHNGMTVNLPVSSVAKPEKEFLISITIDKNNVIYMDKEKILLENLTEHLKSAAKDQKHPGVLLFAQKDIPYQNLFQVLDRIKDAGLSKISLQAERESQTIPPVK